MDQSRDVQATLKGQAHSGACRRRGESFDPFEVVSILRQRCVPMTPAAEFVQRESALALGPVATLSLC